MARKGFQDTSRHVVEPTVKMKPGPGQTEESVTSHPAFIQIGASRVSGGAFLYDSDFAHQHYVVIRINTSTLHRHLNRDWHHTSLDGIVEIAMTESQWATFVSTLNMGSGVPATLQRFNGEIIPGLPAPKPRSDQFGAEVREDLSEALAALADVTATIDAMGLPKGKAETLKEKVRAAHMKLSDSIPWVASSFENHMEDTVERAKMEVHGYMTGVVQRAGLEAIAGNMPLALAAPGEDG